MAGLCGGNEVPPVLVLMGPTASGKSVLGLALAQRFNAEIISVDSAAIYEGMDTGTAKPDRQTRAQIPHHLIDVIPPTEHYSVERFCQAAMALVEEIEARQKKVLFLGGTMMYFNALLLGLDELPGADSKVRLALATEAALLGWPALHARLAALDPKTAERLKPQDAQRIQRALEVYQVSGRPLSSFHGRHRPAPLTGRARVIALMPQERAQLHARIETRFLGMLEAGLLDEVRALQMKYPNLAADMPSMRSVGYRQAWRYLAGDISAEALVHQGVVATRQLAKHQMTWMRKLPMDLTLDPMSPTISEDVEAAVSGWWA